MEELLFLLLPVSAASGWFAARRHYTRKYLIEHTHSLRKAYCRGLNYLLSEKTDKAIEAFVDLLTNDFETVETHIALGNLFRRRGEIEKAIEVHENLIAREDLNPQQQENAQFELGLDYLRAGLFDRAESIFQNLVDHENSRRGALQQLLDIYQHEKEWGKAMECTRQLRGMGKPPKRGETVAHFLCELAEEALCTGSEVSARHWLEDAMREDPRCTRASLLMAKLEMREGRFEEAMQTLKRVESQNAEMLPEIIDPLRICHDRMEKPAGELIGYLGYLYETYGFENAALALAERIRSEQGAAKAIEHMLRVLDNPSLKSLNTLTGFLLEDGAEIQREALIRLDRALDRMYSYVPRYTCTQCGFSGSELHWRCPSCLHWETAKPS